MYGGIRITTIAKASSRPWMSSTVIAASALGAPAREVVDEQVELDPARGLDEDDVAAAQLASRAASAAARSGDLDDRGRAPARARARRGRSRPRPAPDDDQPVDDAGRGRARPAVARLVPVAELEHLAEDGDAPAGHPGEQVERREDGARARRCRNRRRSSRHPDG